MRLIALLLLSLTWTAPAQENVAVTYAYTYHQPSGNRVVAGQGTFPQVRSYDLQLDSPVPWITVSNASFDLPIPERSPLWGTIVAGKERFFAIVDGQLSEVFSRATALPETRPPFIYMDDTGRPYMLDAIDGSELSHPVLLPNGAWAFVTIEGGIGLQGIDLNTTTPPLNALPDARLVINRTGQTAVYVGATNQRYVHGVLGDDLEAAALVVLDVSSDQLEIVSRIDLPGQAVFEGIAPIWADVDQDGADDLITTVSNAQQGAQLRVYRADGSLLATGPAVGQGQRWRHQLAFAPFGPGGEWELVDVLTPHLGGVVEFYQLIGDRLEVVASLPDYSSHVLGTRNLDMAVAGDFNGDGTPEIVVPTQDRLALAGLQRTAAGIQELWRLPLAGTLSTNLAAVTLPNNRLALAAGTADGRLRIWFSE